MFFARPFVSLRTLLAMLTVLTCVGGAHGRVFRVAWMAPGPESTREVNSYTSVNALKLGLNSIAANPSILTGHSIQAQHFNTDCTAQNAMATVLKAQRTFDPDVIIGPPCDEGFKTVAQLGSFWNIPVFSWHNTAVHFDDVSTYPTLVRMKPSLSIIAESLLYMFRKNDWKSFALVHDTLEPWTLYGEALRAVTGVTSVQMFEEYGVNATSMDSELQHMFQKIKRTTQIVVFACPSANVRRLMLAALAAGLINGHYIFIQLDHEVHTEKHIISTVLSNGHWKRNDSDDQKARQAYQYLIHILTDPMNDDAVSPPVRAPRNRYEEFAQLADTVSQLNSPNWTLPLGGKVDPNALFLYDAILVWAVLVDKLAVAGLNTRDGGLVVQRAKAFVADGATGYISINDKQARNGKTFILTMGPDDNFSPVQRLFFNGIHGYSVLRLKPLEGRFTSHAKQAIPQPPTSVRIGIPVYTNPITSTTTGRQTTPLISREELTKPPADTIALLLAKLQALEEKVKMHETHSHDVIPYHTHTPAPVIPYHTHTPAPMNQFMGQEQVQGHVPVHYQHQQQSWQLPQQHVSRNSRQHHPLQQTLSNNIHVQTTPTPILHQHQQEGGHFQRQQQQHVHQPIQQHILQPPIPRPPQQHQPLIQPSEHQPTVTNQQQPGHQPLVPPAPPASSSVHLSHQSQSNQQHEEQTQTNKTRTISVKITTQQKLATPQPPQIVVIAPPQPQTQLQQQSPTQILAQQQQQQQHIVLQQHHQIPTQQQILPQQQQITAQQQILPQQQQQKIPKQQQIQPQQQQQEQHTPTQPPPTNNPANTLQEQAEATTPLPDSYLDQISSRIVDQLTGRLLGPNNNTQSEQQIALNDILTGEESPAGLFLSLSLAHARASQQKRHQSNSGSARATNGPYRNPLPAILDPWGYILGPTTVQPWTLGSKWWGEG